MSVLLTPLSSELPPDSAAGSATPALGLRALARRAAAPLHGDRASRLRRRLALVALLLVLSALPVVLGRVAVVHHRAERQAQAVQALAHGLAVLPGPLSERLQALPSWQGAPAAEVHITDADGQVLAHWQGWRLPVMAPAAFIAALHLPTEPARATVGADGRRLQLAVRVGVADLVDLLWQVGCAGALAVLGLGAAAAGIWRARARAWQRVAGDERQALQARQQALFDLQAAELEQWRRQAHTDALTGLANRRHFLGGLAQWLDGQGDAPLGGLVLLRLRDLAGMNSRLGHAATDRLLQALAQILTSYSQRTPHCLAGRLNGADFALLLPTGGLAGDTARSVLQALRQAIAQIDVQASVSAGALEISHRISASQVLAMADGALAQAELAGPFGVAEAGAAGVLRDAAGQALGEGAWQRRIARALALNHVQLGAFPVCTPDGRALHLDCPLRVRFDPELAYQPAQRWLALAVRSRLSAQVDEKAVALALQAIASDGIGRCVNMSAASVVSPEFVANISRRLAQAPDAACRLWIDLPESLALERPMLVRELSQRWHPLGAMLALEHAGEGLPRVQGLIDLGLDCVRVDARFVHGVARPEAADARRYLRGLVRLVQSVGLLVTAEGVRDRADLEALWALGFDAATGPALLAPARAAPVAPEPPVPAPSAPEREPALA
jgi:diguanylate cyclase (GGDEF)-like protein